MDLSNCQLNFSLDLNLIIKAQEDNKALGHKKL